MDKWRSEWAKKKSAIAVKLDGGACGGSYGEAVLILCAALSALAAEVWPGTGIDRKRFIQLLKRFSPPHLSPTLISVPILAAYLRKKRRKGALKRLRRSFLDFGHSRVLVGQDVDKSEKQILSVCPSLKKREIRESSYANLLYRELRSGYVHEYRPAGKADSWAMTMRDDAQVSYVNWANDPDRHIHFHVAWLSALVTQTAAAVDGVSNRVRRRKPKRWWSDG